MDDSNIGVNSGVATPDSGLVTRVSVGDKIGLSLMMIDGNCLLGGNAEGETLLTLLTEDGIVDDESNNSDIIDVVLEVLLLL